MGKKTSIHFLFFILYTVSPTYVFSQNTWIVAGNFTFTNAVASANSGDTIKFGNVPFGSITSSAIIDKDLNIIGPGKDSLKFFGGLNISTHFIEIEANTNVYIEGLKFESAQGGEIGLNSNRSGKGGAIYNEGNLLIKDCEFFNNRSRDGGAIYNLGVLDAQSCNFSNNYTYQESYPGNGGAISNLGVLVLKNSIVQRNQVGNFGGGIYSNGELTIENSEISRNNSTNGGGIYIRFSNSRTRFDKSKFYENVSSSNGGAIYMSGSAKIIECEIYRNEAYGIFDISPAGGGGIFATGIDTLDISLSSIFENTCTPGGQGGAINFDGNVLSLNKSTLSNNGFLQDLSGGISTCGRKLIIDHCSIISTDLGGNIEISNSLILFGENTTLNATIFSHGNNVIEDSSSAIFLNTESSDIIGTRLNPIVIPIAPLENNGGITSTHALIFDSLNSNLAIRNNHSGINTLSGYDQRGISNWGDPDAGSYEFNPIIIKPLVNTICVSSTYEEIGTISIIDSLGGGLKIGQNQSYSLAIPQGFEFESDVGFISSLDTGITILNYSITSSNITFSYDRTFNPGYNEINISGLKVRSLGTELGVGNLLRLGGTAVQYGNRVIDSVAHATFITNGSAPDADFDWKFNCLGDQTELVDLSSISSGNLNYWDWNLGDNAVSSQSAPLHTFSDTGAFSVQLIVGPDSVCTDTLSKELFVLPVISPTPSDTYFEDFEDSKGGWFTEGNPASSWHWTPAQGFNISDSSNQVWMTGKGGSYFPLEDSWVNSPCFDLSNLRNPIIKLDSWSDSELNFDGAILQSSTDGGFSWNTLGSYANELSSGVNWYNNLLTAGDPVFQFGWTGQEDQSWKSSRHSLALLEGDQSVKFRMAFASDASQPVGSNLDGFAFDNVSIGEQKGNVLLEHFTNLNSPQNNESLQSLDNLLGEYASTLIPIQYHTAYPQADNIYAANPAIPQSRALFYKVDQTNHMIIEGNGFNGSALGVDDNALNRSILNDERFIVEILPLDLLAGDQANVEVRLSPKIPIEGRQLILQTILVEKNRREANKDLQNIARKMLPNPAGVLLKEDWTRASEEFIQHPFSRGGLPNLDNLGIVAFVQDLNSGEILGTDYRDADNFTTNLHQELNEQNQISIYPNPVDSDNNLNIISHKPIYEWGIIDLKGKLVLDRINRKSPYKISIDTKELENGTYILNITFINKRRTYSMFMKS